MGKGEEAADHKAIDRWIDMSKLPPAFQERDKAYDIVLDAVNALPPDVRREVYYEHSSGPLGTVSIQRVKQSFIANLVTDGELTPRQALAKSMQEIAAKRLIDAGTADNTRPPHAR